MPKKRKNTVVTCKYFTWRLGQRGGIWYADGRTNPINAGRHSLATKDREEALRLVHELDQQRAEDLGCAPKSSPSPDSIVLLDLKVGWNLYEKYFQRPRATGGVRPSTARKYGTVFAKFQPFAAQRGITTWNGVSDSVLTDYAQHLDDNGYANASQVKELTTLKQALKWLIESEQLLGMRPSSLQLQKVEGERAYCWRPEEVCAMVQHCRADADLDWLANVVIGLACTGLRISELASLRWVDVETVAGQVILAEESGHRQRGDRVRRQIKSSRSRSFPIHGDWADVLKTMPRCDAFIYHGPCGGRLLQDTVRRVLVREVLTPLAEKFPTRDDEKGFRDGRLHSFRHYFCSTCAMSKNITERMVMDWLGHADSAMVRHYFHLHNDEARRRMNELDFLGGAGGRSTDAKEDNSQEEAEPPADDRKSA